MDGCGVPDRKRPPLVPPVPCPYPAGSPGGPRLPPSLGMVHTLRSFQRSVQVRGTGASLLRAAHHALYLPYSVWTLPRLQGLEDGGAIFDYAASGCGGLFAPFQLRSELVPFLELLRRHPPRRILEIGTANGGTLFSLARVAAPDALVVSLDLPEGPYGGGYQRWKKPLFRSFARPGQRIVLLRGNSHHPGSLERVEAALGGEPLDLLFIDGDHTYEGVKSDYRMYAPLVRTGGIVAFHDIVSHKSDPGYGVHRLWKEIERSAPSRTFVESWEQNASGIGVLIKE